MENQSRIKLLYAFCPITISFLESFFVNQLQKMENGRVFLFFPNKMENGYRRATRGWRWTLNGQAAHRISLLVQIVFEQFDSSKKTT